MLCLVAVRKEDLCSRGILFGRREASLRCASRIWLRGMRNAGKCCRWKGNSLSLSAAPSRGSQLMKDSCSRGILFGRREASLRSASRIWPRGMRNAGKCCRWKGNSLSLSAAPSRGSQLPQDPCSRGILFGRKFLISTRCPGNTTKGSLAAATASAACWLAPQARD